MKIKVLVFDLDLTICDNFDRKRAALERTVNRTFSDDQWRDVKYEYGFANILRQLGVNHDRETIDSILNHFFYDEDLFALDKPFERAVNTLKLLAKHGYTIYYLTGRPIRKTALQFLERFGFPPGKVYSEKVLFGEGWKKVRMLQEIISEARVAPAEIASVGDLPQDGEAAKQLGVFAIGTTESRGFGNAELEKTCDYVIDDVSKIPEVLVKLGTDSG